MATESRLSNVEGRVDELSRSISDFREDLRAIHVRIDQLSGRIDQLSIQVNGRIDRLFLAVLGIGAAQVALLVTLVVRQG